MKYTARLEMFERVRTQHAGFLTSVLWKLTGDRELFAEAFQYSLLEIWKHVEKLNGKQAGAYIYRIALTANSKAWRNRIGRDVHISPIQVCAEKNPQQSDSDNELVTRVRQVVAQLPRKQASAIVMRYMEQQGYQEIAKTLCCSEAGARSHVSKALAALKEKLASYITEE
jgi:RNA polymerase sigma factor (sigma-70 family)